MDYMTSSEFHLCSKCGDEMEKNKLDQEGEDGFAV